MKDNLKGIVNFLFEVGILSKTPRSGFHFLGSGKQSVAEHLLRVVYICYSLAMMEKNINTEKVLKMCLFYDLCEARTSDLNYVHQKYAKANEKKALYDLATTVPFGGDLVKVFEEYEEKKTKESIIAKDADQIELILSLKEQEDIGNKRATTWIPKALQRLKTNSAKKLAKKIITTDSDDWWYGNKNDPWWVNRNKV